MAQQVVLKAQGLYTFPSHLSAVPTGALLRAKNVCINRDNIIESRRGYAVYGDAMGSSLTNTAHQLLDYKESLLRHWGTGSGQYLDWDNGTGTFTPFAVTLTSTTSLASVTVASISSTAQLSVGMFVSGTGVPAGATIASVVDNQTITISAAATAAGAVSLTYTFNIQEVVQGLRIKGVEQNGNFYITTAQGIKKISVLDSSTFGTAPISSAGGIKALDVKATINAGAGFLAHNSMVAYRVLWGIKDANQNLILGSPSERVVITNSDNTLSKTVDIRTTIPNGITAAHFLQIYRTAIISNVLTFDFTGDTTNLSTTVDNISDTSSLSVGMSISGTGIPGSTTITSISSATSIIISNAATATNANVNLTISQELDSTDPGDEQGLVYEANPTTAELNAGYITVTDITTDSFRGANLYTNANSGEGILQANDVPPLAGDIASFKGYTFYANTTTKQRLNLSMLSVANLVSNVSTFTIKDGTSTTTYTFRNTGDGGEDAINRKILLSTAATPSQQVDETSRSLVRVINSQKSEVANAFYISGVEEVPGLLLFEAKLLNQVAFYLNVDNTTTGVEFSPVLPVSGNTVISDDEVSPNRIYYSKYQQPEAVPILNYLDVGPKDKEILRVLALRDSLFVLKEEGVYRISGLVAPFQVYPFDFSTHIVAPDSAVVLNNLIYMFSNQGVATISDTGVAIISRPIEDQLIKLLIPQYTNFTTATFGVTYESDRAYYLFTVSATSDSYATQCFRFNTFTNTWTLFDISKRCGLVSDSDDKLYLGPTDVNYIEQERKSFDRTDFADRVVAQTLLQDAVLDTKITLSSSVNVNANDVVTQVQYVTINQFNRLLSKLDKDSLLSPHDYVSSLTMSAGEDLSDSLDNLITKVANDAGRLAVAGATLAATYLALSPTPSDFAGQQSTFNDLIDLLNLDVAVGYKNYVESENTTLYEFPILSIDKSINTITTNFEYPLIVGPISIYNHIATDLQFVPQYLTDVSITKHLSEGTYIFEDNNFTQATVSYSTDLSGDFEEIVISANGPGTFGNTLYGNGLFGGNGGGVPFRTLVPREKQRCRYVNVRFKHFFAREVFSLYGVSLTFEALSQRGWR